MTGAEAADRARRSRASFLAAVERARPDGKVVGDWTVREVLAHSTGCPGRFEWDRTLTLARAIEENTFAHFDEHAAQLRAAASL